MALAILSLFDVPGMLFYFAASKAELLDDASLSERSAFSDIHRLWSDTDLLSCNRDYPAPGTSSQKR